eukprot:93427_1
MRAALFGDSLQLFFWSIEKVYKQLKQWNQKTLNTFNRINKYENIEMVYAMGLCVFGFAAYISTRYGWTGYVIYETYSGKRERVGEQKEYMLKGKNHMVNLVIEFFVCDDRDSVI